MLSLEYQVCVIEHAKRFKELGIKQDSQFYYCNAKSIGDHILEKEIWMIAHLSQVTGLSDDWFSAFTVAELLEILPISINGNHLTIFAHSELDDKSKYWKIGYVDCLGIYLYFTHAFKLAYALSEMLIYLIETKRITVEEINKCLG